MWSRCRGPRRRARARSSAERSSKASPGSGSSGSTCRSGSLLLPLAMRLHESPTGPTRLSTSPASASPASGLLGLVWGLVHGHGARLDEPPRSSPRSSPARVRWPRSSPGSCAAPAADAADAVLPEPRVRRRERRVHAHVLRHVRLDLPARRSSSRPHRATPRSSPGLRVLPVDGHADVRRADRRRALRSHRRAAAAWRPGWRCRPSALAWIATVIDGDGRLHVARRPVHPRRASGWGCSSRRSRTSCSRPVRPVEEGKASGANNAIREVGGVLGVAVLASIFARAGGYETPATFTDGSCRRSGSARSSVGCRRGDLASSSRACGSRPKSPRPSPSGSCLQAEAA